MRLLLILISFTFLNAQLDKTVRLGFGKHKIYELGIGIAKEGTHQHQFQGFGVSVELNDFDIIAYKASLFTEILPHIGTISSLQYFPQTDSFAIRPGFKIFFIEYSYIYSFKDKLANPYSKHMIALTYHFKF